MSKNRAVPKWLKPMEREPSLFLCFFRFESDGYSKTSCIADFVGEGCLGGVPTGWC